MNIAVQNTAPFEYSTSCLVVPIYQSETLADEVAQLDEKLGGIIAETMREDGFKGKVGETFVLRTNGQITARQLVLVGAGKPEKLDAAAIRKAAAKAARQVRALKKTDFAIAIPRLADPNAPHLTPAVVGAAVVDGIVLGLHRFDDFKTDEDSRSSTQIENVTILSPDADAMLGEVQWAQVTAEANLRARLWVNLPSNKKSPLFLAEQARQIAHENGLACTVWDENRIQSEKMEALYAVGMGSDNPPRFIVLDYSPAGHEHDAPLILVGKGMTFDTGGYSIKPAANMEDMKDDMGGAAVVLGAMSAIAQLKPQCRVMGIVASAENMINGHAMRPGDIVTARNGKTIEILNTDAEGRLILADALSYASELKPAAIIDFATLTGAIGIALGQEAAGLFSNDDDLANRVLAAGEDVGERLWPFPMWDEYREHVKGTVSDVKNIGLERRAGSIAAAVFLEHFVADGIPWAHIDIAAVALVREDRPLTKRGATGFGVRLALELIRQWS